MLSKIDWSFVKTIRFRLTLFYSLVFFIFSGLIILSVNVYLYGRFSELEKHQAPAHVVEKELARKFRYLSDEQIEELMELRRGDYDETKLLSLYSPDTYICTEFYTRLYSFRSFSFTNWTV